MATKRKPDKQEELRKQEEDFLKQARERYEKASEADRENREDAEEDLEFLIGEGQWDDDVKSEREEEDRPILTINRMPQFVRQVVNDMRQARPAIKVLPASGTASKETADVYSGIIRNIETASVARAAYLMAGYNAAASGQGHYRIVTEYADDDTFEQDIRIRRITDPFAVLWDPEAAMPCKEDARYCFVEERIDRETFKARYPKASTHEWSSDAAPSHLQSWMTSDGIRIAEYWVKEQEQALLALTDDNRVVDVTKFDRDGDNFFDKSENAEIPQIRAVRSRKVIRDRVRSYITNGVEILEGPWDFPSRYIPIIPVTGEEVHLSQRVVRNGVIRHAKDPQRLYNYSRSAEAEFVALQPKAPFLITPTQMAEHKHLWQQANRRNLPYLPYNPDPEAPGAPQRQAPPMGSGGLMQEIALAESDMKATTGIYDAALGARSNETSGVAIRQRQQESDISTAAYADNLSLGIQHGGRILVDMIPRVYDTDRIMRIVNEDDTTDFVPINTEVIDEKTGKTVVLHDLTDGKYDVIVTTGPSFSTRRQEAVEAMLNLSQAMPQVGAIIADILIRHMDWPGADEIAKRIKKTLPPGFAELEEGEEDAEPQLTPEMAATAQAG